MENATGLDVVAFMHDYWISKHTDQRRTKAGDEKVASASAVKSIVQHIAKSYSILGYTDDKVPGSRRA
jgi:hypothetical protein